MYIYIYINDLKLFLVAFAPTVKHVTPKYNIVMSLDLGVSLYLQL